ncbi:DNA cytosine methyltransferase [Pseudoalteromonas luteoviolacea]|nr:DNA cytosine methyltransferase [Pseudoalteromonas luteoviolacea]
MELGLNRHVDIAINHDPASIDMHKVNHPEAEHYCESVWDVDPVEACGGRPVGLGWFSPDCRHFSKAKGNRPVDKNIRGLAWVVARWAALVPLRVFMLENVEEFLTWGPVIEIEPGKFKPCPKRKGETFEGFVKALSTGLELNHPAWKEIYHSLFRANFNQKEKLTIFKRLKAGLGYDLEHRILSACDFGVPTTRKRLFMVGRNDGEPVVWPNPTHGPESSGLKPFKTAADIIDWSIPVRSIFGRKRPLADATMKRIAKGIEKFVNCDDPFIVQQTQIVPFITEHANASNQRNMPTTEPLRTICAQVKGGHFALVGAELQKIPSFDEWYQKTKGYGGSREEYDSLYGNGTITSGFIAKHYTGVTGSDIRDPLHTITTVDHNALVTSHIIKLRGDNVGHSANEPLHTISAGGNHLGEVQAFLIKYYGTSDAQSIDAPLGTVTTKDRFGLVTIRGEKYLLVDIGMRMLEPHELFAAMGFSANYQIGHDSQGKKNTKKNQVARCGNAVCPPVAQALVEANFKADIRQVAA